MITSEQLQEYLAGRLSAGERDRFEDELVGDPVAMRQCLEQEKIDTALRMLLGRSGRERVKASIAAVVRGEAASAVKQGVLRDVRTRRRRRENVIVRVSEWLGNRPVPVWSVGLAAAAMVVFGLLLRDDPAPPVVAGHDDGITGNDGITDITGIAEMADVRGRVVVARDGTEQAASNRFALQSGDAIRADADAGGVIRIKDGTRVVLEGGAAIRLGGEDGKEMELTAGRVSAEVAKQPVGRHVVLRTPLATVTVHGTALRLEAAPSSTRLDVSEGWVRMAHAQQDSELELTGGEFALAMPDRELLGGLQHVAVPTKPSTNEIGDRDPALWPFSSASPWNTAIGSQAVFTPVESPSLDFVGRGLVVLPAGHHRAFFFSRPEDPLVPVLRRYGGGEWLRLRLPPDVMSDVTRPMNCTIIDRQSGLAHELIMAGPANGGVQAMLCQTHALHGSGMPPEQSGHSHSGMPLMAGVIREGELRSGIRHALAANVIHHGLSRSGNGVHPFIWPARHVPMETRKLELMSASGNVHFGTLLAIPPDVDIGKLGLGTSGPAFEVARALQDYGTYVTHSYERAPNDGKNWKQPHMQLFAEGVPDSELRELHGVVSRLAGHLRVVTNNRPDRIGGGGQPRRSAPNGLQPIPK
jgi:FecR protein